jgi:hypothetical protein
MTRTDRWTVAAVLALAALLRLDALGRAPLDASEAAHAWRALRLASGGDASADGLTSPSTAAAQALVFAFLGADDALARAPSAACGLALVLVPLVAWSALGRVRALVLCALLALDVRLVEWTRRATGEAAAALGAALVAACLLRWATAARRRADEGRAWATATAVATGFLLTAGPAAWGLLPPLAVVAWRLRPWDAADVRPGRLLAATVAAAIACSTAGLLAIPWASAISASLTEALAGGWSGARASSGAASPTLVAAAVGLAAVPGRRVLVYAIALAWGVLVAGSGASGLALTLACVACAADGLGTMAETRVRTWRALTALAAAALVVLALRGRAFVPRPEDLALRQLAADAAAIAVERGHAEGEMPLVIVGDPPDARIAWALRDLRSVEWVPVLPAGRSVSPLLVAREGTTGTPLAYVRRTYGTGPDGVALWVPRAP